MKESLLAGGGGEKRCPGAAASMCAPTYPKCRTNALPTLGIDAMACPTLKEKGRALVKQC